ncbi:MAG: helicase HerA-like domain-containing protein [Candidatus Limiplasma sp.]|nr:helicase HerA-like domain-containing protein [Candidatus Limiplasma sp.]
MLSNGTIWVGTGENKPISLLPQMANRHGLIAGATGTGKTVSLKVMAEGFSDMGVPVFLGDIKGDLSGMVKPGENTDSLNSRLMAVGVNGFQFQAYPTMFWDVYGQQGHPIRTTVSEMGPLLLSRMLNLNEIQAGVLNILFRVADDEGMLLLDIKDLRAMLAYVGENASRYTLKYGNIGITTVGAIQRALAVLEDQGGDVFFGEPALNIQDWMKVDESGRGYINILACDKLFLSPLMYSTFLLWMLSDLYEILPEVGDVAKPRMVFFFDEAHLLFNNCGKQLMDKIEQVIRLIRSKGVGVYFITQNPTDVPMSVLGQLGNRVQHALRAFTPLDQKAVKVAAQTFRANPSFDTEEAITQLQTGEALLSFLDEKGAPSVVTRALILPPQSFMGPIDADLRKAFIETSPCYGLYEDMVDRESAYEYLAGIVGGGKSMAAPMAAPAPFAAAAPAPVTAPVAPVAPSSTFMVLDPATGQYVQKPLTAMGTAPAPGMAAPAAPAVPAAPTAPAGPTIQQNVLVLDPTTGQYVQKQMNLQLDPATGQYVPVMTEAEQKAAVKAQKEAEAAALKAQKEAERAEKERIAEERRQKADALRDERAERARANNSVLGRVKNTAINQVTRTITNELTRGLMGTILGKKR